MSYTDWHLKDFQGKKIAVVGLGISGRSALELLDKLGAKLVGINRGEKSEWLPKLQNTTMISWEREEYIFESQGDAKTPDILSTCDLIVLSPGVATNTECLHGAKSKKIPVISEIELGALFLESEYVVGVTGTNGKTTVASLFEHILQELPVSHFVGGNIGTPLCEYIKQKMNGVKDKDVVILELSSFQLETTYNLRVHAGIITNIYENHGERYETIEDYFQAKWRLAELTFKNQGKLLVGESCQKYIHGDQPVEYLSSQDEGLSIWLEKLQVPFDIYHLPGKHNRQNLVFALWGLLTYLTPSRWKGHHPQILGALATFKGVEHRLEYVSGEYSFSVYNDAKSTNWPATFTAIEALEEKGESIWLIIGGQPRSEEKDLRPNKTQLQSSLLKKIYLFGESREKLESWLSDLPIEVKSFQSIEEIWEDIAESHFSGVVLFSPAFPSFDQFENYVDRGQRFKALVKKRRDQPT